MIDNFSLKPMILVIPVLLALVLIELGFAYLKGRRVYSFQDSITSINIGLLSQFVNSTGAVFGAVMYALIEARYGTFEWSTSSPFTWIFALLLYDFLYYWVHRTGHMVNIFWAAHITHHSSEEFNLSTAMRQASTGFYFKWVFYLPLAVLGIPVQVYVIVGLIDLLYQFWVHTRLIGRLGFLEWFLVTLQTIGYITGRTTTALTGTSAEYSVCGTGCSAPMPMNARKSPLCTASESHSKAGVRCGVISTTTKRSG